MSNQPSAKYLNARRWQVKYFANGEVLGFRFVATEAEAQEKAKQVWNLGADEVVITDLGAVPE